MTFGNYEEAVNHLMKIPLFGKKAGLKNIRVLLEKLDNPHNKLKFIHVAGTNGKGSVCTMLSYMYAESGYNVGLFTSPHLVSVNERIKLNNHAISNIRFLDIYQKVYTQIQKMLLEGYYHPTFFEVIFAVALVYFVEEQLDFAIIEVGIGGRLDSTNIIPESLISIITSIDLDHTNILGDKIESIAYEKGGIIKTKGKVVMNVHQEEAVEVIINICRRLNATYFDANTFKYDISKRKGKSIDFSINSKYYSYDGLVVPLNADYQLYNLSTALLAVEVLKKDLKISKKQVYESIKKIRIEGRMEIINDNILLEGAHNPSGITYFVEHLKAYYHDKAIMIVFSMMKDKDYLTVVESISTIVNLQKVIICTINHTRSMDDQHLKKEFLEHGVVCEINSNVAEIIEKQNKATDNKLLCFVGSLYLIGEVKRILQGGSYD